MQTNMKSHMKETTPTSSHHGLKWIACFLTCLVIGSGSSQYLPKSDFKKSCWHLLDSSSLDKDIESSWRSNNLARCWRSLALCFYWCTSLEWGCMWHSCPKWARSLRSKNSERYFQGTCSLSSTYSQRQRRSGRSFISSFQCMACWTM